MTSKPKSLYKQVYNDSITKSHPQFSQESREMLTQKMAMSDKEKKAANDEAFKQSTAYIHKFRGNENAQRTNAFSHLQTYYEKV